MRNPVNSLRAVTRSITLVFILGYLAAAAAQQRSDFEIVKSFQTKYKAIRESIREAKTVQECAEIHANIGDLQKEYAADTTLLNKALYPDKYDDEISEGSAELRLAQDRLGIIDSQMARITGLEMQVRTLSEKVDSLSRENDRLMASLDVMSKSLQKNTKAIDSLNKIISQLRRGLRARDAAIFALADSMFMQYGSNVQELPERQKKILIGKVERHNVVAAIQQSAEQNMKFLETTQLSGNDLVQMLREQHRFGSYWKGLGPRLAALYSSRKESEKQLVAVDTAVARWGRKADSLLWAALYKEFASNQIPVDSFSNAGEFVANVEKYFDTQGGDKNASGAEKYARLNHFLNDVWNPSIGTQWLPMLVDEGFISKDQQSILNTKLTTWEASVKPSHTLMYVGIVILVILIAIGARILYLRAV